MLKSILSGALISLGGIAFLKVGGIIGAVLFTFGLITIISERYSLYTGMAGFIDFTRPEIISLAKVLLFNIIGAFIVGSMAYISWPELASPASSIVESRLAHNPLQVFLLAVFCGFIMTEVVNHARNNNNWKPLLYGIPLFIMCGMYHSIADSFYYSVYTFFNGFQIDVLALLVVEIIGNFIGCNLGRSQK